MSMLPPEPVNMKETERFLAEGNAGEPLVNVAIPWGRNEGRPLIVDQADGSKRIAVVDRRTVAGAIQPRSAGGLDMREPSENEIERRGFEDWDFVHEQPTDEGDWSEESMLAVDVPATKTIDQGLAINRRERMEEEIRILEGRGLPVTEDQLANLTPEENPELAAYDDTEEELMGERRAVAGRVLDSRKAQSQAPLPPKVRTGGVMCPFCYEQFDGPVEFGEHARDALCFNRDAAPEPVVTAPTLVPDPEPEPEPEPEAEPTMPHICVTCGQRFKRPQDLKGHSTRMHPGAD